MSGQYTFQLQQKAGKWVAACYRAGAPFPFTHTNYFWDREDALKDAQRLADRDMTGVDIVHYSTP